jgi:assimilatory nitrate reductase catalytic subunit
VLPAAQWAEEDGTVTNLEGRVLRRRRALEPPGGVRTDLEILGAIAGRLGGAALFPSSDPRTIFDELRRASAGGLADYSAITWERIDAEGGVIWGDPRLFTHRFATPDGRAVFHATPWEPPAESPDADYPLHLLTGRVLAHYQSGTQTRRVRVLVERSDGPTVAVHPRTAARHGLVEGDDVTISSRRGAARVSVRVSTTVREDTVFVPFHWGGQGSINRVTHAALDPTSKMPELKVCAVKLEKVGSR